MIFNEPNFLKAFGRVSGFVVSYFIFTVLLYFILNFFKNEPVHYSGAVLITLTITLIGFVLRKALR